MIRYAQSSGVWEIGNHRPCTDEKSYGRRVFRNPSTQRFGQAMEVCFNSKNLDGILVILVPQAITDPLSVAKALISAVRSRKYPVFACWMGEFSVLVGDAWQGQGIGSSLLEKCLSIAEKHGFKKVHGIVLAENSNVLALGKKLGFDISRDPGGSDNNLVIHLG